MSEEKNKLNAIASKLSLLSNELHKANLCDADVGHADVMLEGAEEITRLQEQNARLSERNMELEARLMDGLERISRGPKAIRDALYASYGES